MAGLVPATHDRKHRENSAQFEFMGCRHYAHARFGRQ
jgi:hypothetical protein